MINLIRKQLVQIIDDIDSGNSNITQEQGIEIANMLAQYNEKNKPISKYQAYMYLGVSRATFDNLVSNGKLPEGKKQAGFKEKLWYKKDLDLYRNNTRRT